MAVDAARRLYYGLAAYCDDISDGRIRLRALLASLDGQRIVRAESKAGADRADQMGRMLAQELLAAGGREILDGLKSNAEAGA